MRPSIQLANGLFFSFECPDQSVITIEGVASSLSKLCRYTGHCKEFYSVAQHSILVSYLVPQEYALQGLLHDAAEAFLGDVSSPLKQLLPDYKALEELVEGVVHKAFGLPEKLAPEVKRADIEVLYYERKHLMPEDGDTTYWSEAWGDMQPEIMRLYDSFPPIQCWPWEKAKGMFMRRYRMLTH